MNLVARARRIAMITATCALVGCVAEDATLAVDSREEAIVGGGPTPWGDHPWLARLHHDGVFSDGSGCAGMLIAPRWLLTAGHCIDDDHFDYARLLEGASRVSIVRRIPHPDYDRDTADNDIGLVELENPVVALPLALNLDDGVPTAIDLAGATAADANATTMGWGNTSEGGSASDELLRVDVPIVTNGSCQDAYGDIQGSHLCAGVAAGGLDACKGDSGGPLIADGLGGTLLVGVVSRGDGCARPMTPGVYTRASSFTGWIRSHVPQVGLRSPTAILVAAL